MTAETDQIRELLSTYQDAHNASDAETAAREMAEFTGTTNLPPTAAPGDANTGGMAQTTAYPAAQLPAGVSPAVITEPTASPGYDVGASANQATLPADTLPATAQPYEKPPTVNEPVSAGATTDDEIAAQIQRLEIELRKRREAEIRRLEEELRLRKQQNEVLTDGPGSSGGTSE